MTEPSGPQRDWAARDELATEIRGLMASAEAFARHAGQITLQYFGRTVDVSSKADGTPVTIADRTAEQALRRDIERRYPEHGIVGEEFGGVRPDARVCWIVDPIDGTKSFVRGVPLYGVLVGVEVDGEPAVGVAHFPALDETVVAGTGQGCRWNGHVAHVSRVDRLHDAAVLTTDEQVLADSPHGAGYEALRKHCAFARTWGDAYGHLLVATGRAEIMIDPLLELWDAAPLLPIVTESGGRFTTLDGEADIRGGSGISTNGILHDQVLRLLG